MKVPFLDLKQVNNSFFQEIKVETEKVLSSGSYILGETVEKFEQSFADYHNIKDCVGVGNGFDALLLAFEALDLPPESEVILASNSYIATVLAVIRAGYRPVLVEPEIETYNINPNQIEGAITAKSRVICVTHLYGKSSDMAAISRIAKANSLFVIEDCAQAHGARFCGQKVGTFGVMSCFSFYPTKNLGGIGDGGAVLTNDKRLAEVLRKNRNYGFSKKDYASSIGLNSRLDPIQAAALIVKLKYLDAMNAHRRILAEAYWDGLPDWLVKPKKEDTNYDVFHIFPVRTLKRDLLRTFLEKNGIGTSIHYPVPINLQQPFKKYFPNKYPISEEIHKTVLSLPISSAHKIEEVKHVTKVLNEFEYYDC